MEKGNLRIQVLDGIFWRFGERICAQLVTFVVSVILARILEPSDYGVVSLITIFITIANVFVTDGFGKALIQKKNADSCDYSSVFYFNIFFSWFVYGVMFFFAPVVARFYGNDILIPTLRVLALKLPLAAINSVQQAYVSRNMLFKRFFWATLVGTLISAIVGIFMAVNGFGVWSLVAQYLTNSFVDTVVLWFVVKWRPTLEFCIKRLKKLIQFGWKILLTSLINSAYDNVRSLIIGRVYTGTDLAYYTRGIHYPQLIITNVNTSISSVLYPVMSKMQDDKEKLKAGMRKSISVSTYIIFPLMAGLAAVAPRLVSAMLTDKWMLSVPYLRIACIYFALYPINITNLQAIMAVGRSDVYLKLNIVKKIIGIACVIISIPFGVKAIAASEIIVGVTAITTNISANRKIFEYTAYNLIEDIYKNIILSLSMCLIVCCFDKILYIFNFNTLIALIFEFFIGIASYLSGSIVLKSYELKYILEIIKNRRN